MWDLSCFDISDSDWGEQVETNRSLFKWFSHRVNTGLVLSLSLSLLKWTLYSFIHTSYLQIKLSLTNWRLKCMWLQNSWSGTAEERKFPAAGIQSEQQSALIALARRPFGGKCYMLAFVFVCLFSTCILFFGFFLFQWNELWQCLQAI